MKLFHPVFSIILPVLVLAGCVHVSVTRMGERFPPYPKNCKLDFRYGDMGKAMQLASSGYVQVGSISVVDQGDSFDDAMKARVRPIACQLGGQIVMMTSSSPGSFTTNYPCASIVVFRKNGVASPKSKPGNDMGI